MSEDAAPEPEEAQPEAPPKKRKKKKRKSESIAAGRPDWWPAFADSFPRDPTLDDLVAAFENGNYARVREGAQRLLDARPEHPDDVRSAARDLLRRIDPDPLATYLLLGACLLLMFLAGWYWMRGGAH